MNRNIVFWALGISTLMPTININAQENTAGISRNIQKQNAPTAPPNTLQLPFFDDFSYDGPFVNSNLWETSGVYINNHMAIAPISHGIATFDAWNNYGTPYDTLNRYASRWADTLASQPIDLSNFTVADDIVLSFYIQQEGKGFQPHTSDSIAAFFYDDAGNWKRMWINGLQTTNDFLHVRIRIEDASFLHDAFQFRFINKAQMNINNSNWHLDYVHMDVNRQQNTNDIHDLAITTAPTSILKGYHSMPFRHFKINPAKYLAPNLEVEVRNNSLSTQNISLKSSISFMGNSLSNATQSVTTGAMNTNSTTINNVSAASLSAINNGSITLNGLYTINDPIASAVSANDTMRINYVFEEEFAYDDGTPELAYFVAMHQSYNIPAQTAVKYELETADTLRGFSIHLPQGVPIPRNKEFAIRVYRDIQISGGQDQLMYQEDFFYPAYSDTVNEMVRYKLAQGVPLPTGTFYLTLVQPAGGFSDSLYVGLDVDRDSKEHRFVNTQGQWEPSSLNGSLLFRPIVGKDFQLSLPKIQTLQSLIYPNPTQQKLFIQKEIKNPEIRIYDINGRLILNGNGNQIDVSSLRTGSYLVQVYSEGKSYPVERFTKID